ncbi:acireductone synthase [Frankia sp. CNm7]|uniref:Enolase-phosphatase E1 n=1 Tax=Frankia nepalensis TaxID=1836974 RepID=A0A937RSG9_9ACTN|nr:acireductone synthase [Frankia nepalensis]MBL7499926.1 acireductone synthase [Frankia nepalensis]MBL7511711.1 acireductone synthase [Frankia nepalensis]MBL7523167.1 acireductone synthase [Frankia nepalensis]MBL7632529.1 acireductone synthase [Frankia nepalensis]
MTRPGTPRGTVAGAGHVALAGVTAVVLDIEGTVSPTEAVVGTLYPYAQARLAGWLAQHGDDPETVRAIAQVRELIGEPDADVTRVVAALDDWRARDVKAAPLKTLQGRIWAAGFAAGELTGVFFDDVVPALRRWHAAGITLAVYSSGSVAAQRAWFGHAAGGAGDRRDDLRPLLAGYFDLDSAGPKTDPGSYARIAAALGAAAPRPPLFLTDRPTELDAANAAGWTTVGVARPGEPYAGALAGYRHVASFADLDLAG